MEVIARDICKSYGSNQALKGVSFEVKQGEIFGVIGADGAGKTTLFRILTSLMLADSGRAEVHSLNVVSSYKELRQHIGYMPGKFSLYLDLTVEENLSFFATLFGTTIQKNYHLIKDIYQQIEPFKNRRAGKLSGGMKQKLALSCALIHSPSVLFLDEPTTGVDPVSRREFWAMLRRLKDLGITIIVSTPYMDEAKLCDRIAFIQSGKILSVASPDDIIKSFGQNLYAISARNMPQLLNIARTYSHVSSCHPFGSSHHICVSEQFDIDKFKEYLTNNSMQEVEIQQIEPTIEDCYMKIANEDQ